MIPAPQATNGVIVSSAIPQQINDLIEVGIYKRKQENTLSTKKVIKKKERKHALDKKKR